jgi:hypothetical protein
VKEEHARRGWKITAGSVLFKDEVSHENHPGDRQATCSRRHPARPNDGARIFLDWSHLKRLVGRNAQSLEPGLHPWRFLRRICRCTGGRYDYARDRVGHGWVDPYSFCAVRPVRIKTSLRPDCVQWAECPCLSHIAGAARARCDRYDPIAGRSFPEEDQDRNSCQRTADLLLAAAEDSADIEAATQQLDRALFLQAKWMLPKD